MNTRRLATVVTAACAPCVLYFATTVGRAGAAEPEGARPAQAAPATTQPPATRPVGRGNRGGNAPAGAVKLMPPGDEALSPADRQELEAGAAKLGKEIDALRQELKDKPALLALMPDVQIYHNAVRYPVAYHEMVNVPNARKAVDEGMSRAKQLRDGKPGWVNAAGPRGYVSKIDGSVQPYLVAPPPGFAGNAADKKYRLDLFCHGRSENLTELAFLYGREGNAPAPGADKFVVNLYGRYCNANKFAGEIDCFEVMDDLRKRHPIDEDRILMIGFSMGGASAWQFGVHYPDVWAATSPGAGFSESKEFLNLARSGELARTPWYEKTLWHLYDCTDYAANLFNLPLIAYAGEIDPQKQASDAMMKAMEAEGLKLERIIGPKTAHAYEKGARADLMKRLDDILAKGRNPYPSKIRFTTWTLRYNHAFWLTVEGMGKHWERARADAEVTENGVKLATENVTGLTLYFPDGRAPFAAGAGVALTIDGSKIEVPPVGAEKGWKTYLVKSPTGWRATHLPSAGGELRKRHGLQGPIDDAFLDSFVVVRPTGKPLNDRVGAWAAAEGDRAVEQWRRHFRGEARVRTDEQVSDADIAGSNLVLFGDPSSNKVLAKVIDKLPVKWTAETVTVSGQSFPADRHAAVMIYPNPLNPAKYVVLNSGFTFREFDYLNNARQTPKLPDWAVVDVSTTPTPRAPGAIPAAGFFGERWEVQPDPK